MRRLLLIIWVLFETTGCGSSIRQCPAPVGRIVLEDCTIYRQQFEELRVGLMGQIGGVMVSGDVAKEKLRGPSKNLEILGHRLHALCRDHNACRMSIAEYSAERDALNKAMTTMAVLSDQLKTEKDVSTRTSILTQLREVISQAAAVTNGPSAPVLAIKRYSGWYGTWMDSRLSPRARPEKDAGPQLVDHKFSVKAHFKKQGRGQRSIVIGWRPSIRIELWWPEDKYAADDALLVDWGGDEPSVCAVKRRRGNAPGIVVISCGVEKTVFFEGEKIRASLSYRTGADGKVQELGVVEDTLMSAGGVPEDYPRRYGVDHSPVAARSSLLFMPVDGKIPAIHGEQPHIEIVLKFRDRLQPLLRCAVDGKDLFGALQKYGRGGGQHGWFQDRPRYIKVNKTTSRAVKDNRIEWWRYRYALPFATVDAGKPPPEGLSPWPRAGQWECRVILDGETLRKLSFTVLPDGKLEVPEGLKVFGAKWPLTTETLSNKAEETQ